MVWLIGHRQPKGAATAMLRPTATAPHLDSTGCATRRFEADRPLSGYERSLSRSIRGSTRLPGESGCTLCQRRRTQPGPATLARGTTTRPPTLNDGLGDRESAASRGPCRCSDFGLLSELQRIVDLDAEVAHCALKSS